MATRKSTKATAKVEKPKLFCSCCGKEKDKRLGFYVSNSIVNKYSGKLSICKECVWQIFDEFVEESHENEKVATYRLCRLVDFPYLEKAFDSAMNECEKSGSNVFKTYIKNINSLKQYTSFTFENGDSIDDGSNSNKSNEVELVSEEVNLSERDAKNEEDVLKMLGYDPFETENKKDRKYLFNRLVDMLDDSTLEDNLLLMSIIEIVKGFNQVDKINEMIATLTSDTDKLSSNTGGIKGLIDTKKNLMTTILKIAEDNGISTKFNTTKSKGAGTLAGIIKTLNDIGLDEAKINLYDIETSKSMRQIADISHQSILNQLVLNESDYTDMLAQQKDMLYNLNEELMQLREENRKLKVGLREKGMSVDDLSEIEDCEFEEV